VVHQELLQDWLSYCIFAENLVEARTTPSLGAIFKKYYENIVEEYSHKES